MNALGRHLSGKKEGYRNGQRYHACNDENHARCPRVISAPLCADWQKPASVAGGELGKSIKALASIAARGVTWKAGGNAEISRQAEGDRGQLASPSVAGAPVGLGRAGLWPRRARLKRAKSTCSARWPPIATLRKESGSEGSQCLFSASVALAEAHDSAVSAQSTKHGRIDPPLRPSHQIRKPGHAAPAFSPKSHLFPRILCNSGSGLRQLDLDGEDELLVAQVSRNT